MNSSGSATASVLYGPYGTARYTNGAMPTDYVFTGQRGDAATGLDYYGARYYDPSVGQFTSADSTSAGGLNRYAYVHDDPETLTDPTGHLPFCGVDCGNAHEPIPTPPVICQADPSAPGCFTPPVPGCTLSCLPPTQQSSEPTRPVLPGNGCSALECAEHVWEQGCSGDLRACEFGSDAHGLWSFIANELGGSPSGVLLNGYDGITEMIGLLGDLKDAGDSWFAHLEGILVTGTSAAGAFLKLAGLLGPAGAAILVGAGVTAGAVAIWWGIFDTDVNSAIQAVKHLKLEIDSAYSASQREQGAMPYEVSVTSVLTPALVPTVSPLLLYFVPLLGEELVVSTWYVDSVGQ